MAGLKDSSLKVRVRAASVLAQHGSREGVPLLCKVLSDDDAVAVRVAAASALGRIGGAEAVPLLRDASAHDPNRAVRAAASRALARILKGARTVCVEDVQGDVGDQSARVRLRDALAAQLERHGFAVVPEGEDVRYRLKPFALLLEEEKTGASWRIEVKASLVALDSRGRIAAMVEGGARARSARGSAPPQLLDQALDAAARSLSEDLARRLLERQ